MGRRPGLPADTIVAVATGPAAGAIGVVRLTGQEAVACASGLLRLRRGVDLRSLGARVLAGGQLLNPCTGAVLDEVLVVVMPAPHSYTGEDVVEISCHGNPVLLAEVVRMATDQGARLAEPGEFTRRAYVNGRMDLMQAEAVSWLIAARTVRSVELAARQIVNGASTEVFELREEILDVLAGLEVSIDFPEDAVGVSRTEASRRVEATATRLRHLGEKAQRGRAMNEGVAAMIAGAPNVGKSSLLNALLGRNRAIVAPQPGTTRDVVEGLLNIGGVPVLLQDGAGLGVPKDALDAEGMRRTGEAIESSHLLVIVLDLSRPISPFERELLRSTGSQRRLIVGSKSDLEKVWSDVQVDCVCSAHSGEGIADVLQLIEVRVKEAVSGDSEEGSVLASIRAMKHLECSQSALEGAAIGLREGMPIEVVLVDLRQALLAIDEAVGIEAEDALLDRIFKEFCVGK